MLAVVVGRYCPRVTISNVAKVRLSPPSQPIEVIDDLRGLFADAFQMDRIAC